MLNTAKLIDLTEWLLTACVVVPLLILGHIGLVLDVIKCFFILFVFLIVGPFIREREEPQNDEIAEVEQAAPPGASGVKRSASPAVEESPLKRARDLPQPPVNPLRGDRSPDAIITWEEPATRAAPEPDLLIVDPFANDAAQPRPEPTADRPQGTLALSLFTCVAMRVLLVIGGERGSLF